MAEQESLLQSSDPHLQLLLKQSVRYSFFQAMRQIETTYSSMPRVGYSSSPSQEPFRIQQPADLAFAPTAIDSVSENLDGKISIEQRFFGLLGPSGPLPLHLTEIVRNRSRHANDSALQSFLDIFHHRMASLFYRAWSSARPAVQRDRPKQDRFGMFLGALVGVGMRNGRDGDAWLDESKRYFAGRLGSLHRNTEGLTSMVESVVNTPVCIEPFSLRWLPLSTQERTKLGGKPKNSSTGFASNCLGRTTVLGQRVADRQSHIDMRLGPMSYSDFHRILPGSSQCTELRAVIRTHLGSGMDAIIRPILQKEEVPPIRLGSSGQLGRNAWVYSKPIDRDRDDYCFSTSSINSHCSTESVRSQP